MNKKFTGFDAFKLSDEVTHTIIDRTINASKAKDKHRKRLVLAFVLALTLIVSAMIIQGVISTNSSGNEKPGGVQKPDFVRPDIKPQKVQLALIKDQKNGLPDNFSLQSVIQMSRDGFGHPSVSEVFYGESFDNPSMYQFNMLTNEQVKSRIDGILYTLTNKRFSTCEIESKDNQSDCIYNESISQTSDFNEIPYGYTLSLNVSNLELSVNSFNEVTIQLNFNRTFPMETHDEIMGLVRNIVEEHLGELLNIDDKDLVSADYEKGEDIRIVRTDDKYQSFPLAEFKISNSYDDQTSRFQVVLKTNLTEYELDGVISPSQAETLLREGKYVQNTSFVNFVKENFGETLAITEIVSVDTLISNAGVLEYAVPMYRFHVYVEGVAIDGEELLVELFVPAL